MQKNKALLPISVLFSATLLATPFHLHAAETKQIARSSKLGIELFGVDGENWCKPSAKLKLSLESGSALAGKEENLFPKISKIFASECPKMETAEVVVFDSDGTLTRSFEIAKEAGWGITVKAPLEVEDSQTKQSVNEAKTEQKDVAAIEPNTQTLQEDKPVSPTEQAETNVAAKPEQARVEKAAPLTAENMFLLAAHYKPEMLDDARVIDQLATLESCDRYMAVRENEFELRDWRKEVLPAVKSEVDAVTNLVEFSFNFRVNREYDFDTAMLDIGSFIPRTQEYNSTCGWRANFRNNVYGGLVHLSFEDLPDTFNRKIYLPDQLGRAAVDQLEAANNNIRVTYRARIKDVGIVENWAKYYELKAEFVDVKIHTGKQSDYLLVHHGQEKFAAARKQHQIALEKAEEEQRKAEEQRLAAQREHEEELRRLQRDQENAQAQRLFDSLAGENAVPAKLAALHHDGNTSFNNPYDLAARAFAQGGKFPVRAFVKVGDRDSVGYKATWPERVYLTGAELEEDEWYFVSGMIDGQKIDNTLQSMIAVDLATKCDDRICMDEQDVMDYVRSVYPQWSGMEE